MRRLPFTPPSDPGRVTRRGARAAARVGLAALALALTACATLPPPQPKARTTALPPVTAAESPLARALEPAIASRPRLSGIHVLGEGSRDFAARLQLVASAVRSVDLQTYIFHPDHAGLMMARELMAAAERGVRVRLLVDDNQTKGLDPLLALMARHPNLQVRLFNPYANRGFRIPELLRDLKRLNSRMHAKAMIVDGRVAIMGGRNIGNEYADLADNVNFTDLDVLVVGAVVAPTQASFDRFWNDEQAYAVAELVPPSRAWTAQDFERELQARGASAAAERFASTVAAAQPVQDLLEQRLPMQWAPAALWVDDPAAPESEDPDSPLDVPGRLVPRLRAALNAARSELDLVSPYFVPDQESSLRLQAIARNGVKVRLLTNSLAATDVVAVHSGYAKHRADLLRAGVRIFELKPTAVTSGSRPLMSINGSSSASLHAKAFAVDRRRLFVGSFNLDPRSARLNDELVLVADSPVLASQLSQTLDRTLPSIAYEVTLAADGTLAWRSGAEVVRSEPQATMGRRALSGTLSLFDLDWLL